MIYLLHLTAPFAHAKHYVGWTKDSRTLTERIKHHRAGSGATFTRRAREAGIDFVVAALWEGDRTDERRLHRRGKTAICPICSARVRRPKLRPLDLPALAN